MTKYESFVWNSRPTWYSLNLRMSSVMCKLPCLLTYSVTLSCLITLAKCAPVTYCPNFDGTPQFYSDEDGKCHLCLSCEEGYGLSEECGAGLGQRARCIPCPSGKYSPNYDWNVCGFCRICDNTMEDKIPCTSRTDRQCGPCKLGYFRHDERYDFCVRCEDERNSHLYPDCLRTTPRVTSLHSTMAVTPANIINTSQYSVSTASTENTGLKPWTVVIVILCICVVIVVLMIGIYFFKDHLCSNSKKHVLEYNNQTTNKKNGSPAETKALIADDEGPSVPDLRLVAGETTTHNGRNCEESRQGATLFCGPDDSVTPCHQAQDEDTDSRRAQNMTVGDGDETSGQSQSCEDQLPDPSNNSTECKETQTEDVGVAAPSDQVNNVQCENDKTFKEAVTISQGVTVSDMHNDDRQLLKTMLHEKPALLSTSIRFHYVRFGELFGIPRNELRRMDTAEDVLDWIATSSEHEYKVADILNKLKESGRCFEVVRKLASQIVKRQ